MVNFKYLKLGSNMRSFWGKKFDLKQEAKITPGSDEIRGFPGPRPFPRICYCWRIVVVDLCGILGSLRDVLLFFFLIDGGQAIPFHILKDRLFQLLWKKASYTSLPGDNINDNSSSLTDMHRKKNSFINDTR